MKIICSTNIPYAREAFGRLGDVVVLPPSGITAKQVRDADIMCIRSTTRADSALLEGSRVRFVGTTTIGIDHMDTDYMDRAGIAWRSAAGCNANSVSEYVTAGLLCVARRHDLRLEGKTVGVIGIGNVGRLVVEKAEALGLRVLLNDPPRQEIEGKRLFKPLPAVLAESDIITLHTPLTRSGNHPTFHLADERFFRKLKPGAIFINSARGAVLKSDALLNAIERGGVSYAILDTWEDEPEFRNDVLDRVELGTPHIAGHSFDGKVTGTLMIFREACRFLGVESDWTPATLLPPPIVPEITLDADGQDDEPVLWELVRKVYDIEEDDRLMRASAPADAALRRENFERLRQNYPVRREFHFTRVTLRDGKARLEQKAAGLGFMISRSPGKSDVT